MLHCLEEMSLLSQVKVGSLVKWPIKLGQVDETVDKMSSRQSVRAPFCLHSEHFLTQKRMFVLLNKQNGETMCQPHRWVLNGLTATYLGFENIFQISIVVLLVYAYMYVYVNLCMWICMFVCVYIY